MIVLCTNNTVVIDDFYLPFHKKTRSVLTCLVWRSVFPVNLTWTSLILWPLFPVTVAYPVPSQSTFQTSHTFPFLTQFQRKLREMFLRWGVAGLSLNPQAGRSLILSYPWLLILCIRGNSPYLEAVSSIRNVQTHHAIGIRPTLRGQSMSSHVISLRRSFIFPPCVWPHGLFLLHFVTKISYAFLNSTIRVTTLCSHFLIRT
jgi:hypothetical protein